MTRSEEIIRIVTASLATLVAAFFVLGYSGIWYHNYVTHQQLSLPVVTGWVAAAAPWAFFVPLAVVVLGLVWHKRHLVVMIITSVAWLFSLAWPLLCIHAWEMCLLLL